MESPFWSIPELAETLQHFPDNLYKLTGQTENVETLLNFDCLVAANKLAVRDGDDYI